MNTPRTISPELLTAIAAELRAELERHTDFCLQVYDAHSLSFATLNAVQIWLQADARHWAHFRQHYAQRHQARRAAEQPLDDAHLTQQPSLELPAIPASLAVRYARTARAPDCDTAVEREAMRYLRYRDRNFTPARERALLRWMADPAHQRTFLHLNALREALLLQRRKQLFSDAALSLPLLPSLRQLSAAQLHALANEEGARALERRKQMLPAAGAWIFLMTKHGHHDTLHLEDYFKLDMNTATQIHLRTLPHCRRLRLHAGEVYLQHPLSLCWPLIVQIDGVRLHLEDGAVRIRRHGAWDFELWVYQGAARLYLPSPVNGPAPLRALDLTVQDSQHVRVTAQGVSIAEFAPVRCVFDTLWRNGLIHFERTPLRDVVSEYQRYLKTPLELTAPELGDLPVSGDYSTEDAAGLLEVLARKYGVHSERREPAPGELGAIRLLPPQ